MQMRILLLIAASAFAIPAAARDAGPPASPAERFGDLFAAVQMARLFPDGKSFADATARRPDADILAGWRRERPEGETALKAFVAANFIVPDAPAAGLAEARTPGAGTARPPVRAHIRMLWPELTRPPAPADPRGSALALPRPYVVPGGRFRELYYWDSYFTMLGLARDGRDDLVEDMIDDFGSLIDRYGHIPNGTRSYYLSRSQPPVFWLMIGLSRVTTPAVRQRRLAELRREHDYWMRGGRVVRLPDGNRLNRYWDDRATPRDESWREDVLTAQAAPKRPAAEVYRDLRAGAESGWDYSARWLADGRTLATIRTTAIAPVDLNALLYGMERAIAAACRQQRDRGCVADYEREARLRRATMRRWMWRPVEGRFADILWSNGAATSILSGATLAPLFTGLATPAEAKAVAATVRARLLAPGGLRTTTVMTGQQWDKPNGWAPLQWIAVAGLRRYGERKTADTLSARFIATAEREYRASGRMLEKYDVEETKPGGGGEYPLQDGFGWTNGVVAELIDEGP
ncbi:alpha,alpha-trehalase TreF [Flavisphingomonas formosensis]|uniref:alpha,alpha-trehalase TreF n=1 Tax=Flavisphingomonas formosensis TaxID=861534 RepID=UPI0012F9E2BD|nr:alpha,alpha-trehalase TreF [Sphingomonas formosensis]